MMGHLILRTHSGSVLACALIGLVVIFTYLFIFVAMLILVRILVRATLLSCMASFSDKSVKCTDLASSSISIPFDPEAIVSSALSIL
jgi:hypothetical protein